MIENNQLLHEEAEHLAQQHNHDSYAEYLREVEMIYKDLLAREERLNKEHEV